MTDATLIVDGPPSEWLPGTYDEPLLTIVRVDGDLPTVQQPCRVHSPDSGTYPRPLRVGDRVTLATPTPAYTKDGYEAGMFFDPFATATVANIDTADPEYDCHFVTVENVEALT